MCAVFDIKPTLFTKFSHKRLNYINQKFILVDQWGPDLLRGRGPLASQLEQPLCV